MKVCIAVDIGASSGRLIAGYLQDKILKTQEIYRFKNGFQEQNGHFVWDLEHLFNEIVNGLKVAKQKDLEPISLGIDTWAVDYVLLDKDDKLTAPAYAYRDSRINGVDKELYKIISAQDLYKRNGIQKLAFNTIYQLYEQKLHDPKALESAESFLMIPDYLNFKLTGIKKNEYTNATTSQLVSPITENWDYELISKLGLPQKIFKPLCKPGTSVGRLKSDLVEKLGFDLEVVMVTSHDTASAVVAAPLTNNSHIYLSSGTWSLMGIERKEADCTQLSYEHNFTNEGGYDYRYRYLKNIMGLWILQNLRREIGFTSFEDVYQKALSGKTYTTIVDVNDDLFLAPPSMKQAFIDYCKAHNLKEPHNDNEILFCAYNSLAHCYQNVVQEIESVTSKTYDCINIIGGGSQDKLLNSMIADITGKIILTGPVEGTAIGNLCVQLIKLGLIADLESARKLITQSFAIEKVNSKDLLAKQLKERKTWRFQMKLLCKDLQTYALRAIVKVGMRETVVI